MKATINTWLAVTFLFVLSASASMMIINVATNNHLAFDAVAAQEALVDLQK